MTHHSPTRRPRSTTRRATGLAAAVACLLGTAAAVIPAPAGAAALSSQDALAAVRLPRSTAFDGTPRVGALFGGLGNSLDGDFCTASVVDSPGHDLLLTAAHCVVAPGSGSARSDLVFVPGFVSGRAPYGRWTVRKAVVDNRWAAHGDPDYDVAFLTTAPAGHQGRVQDVVGAEHLGFGPQPARPTAVAVAVGYPWHSGRPVHCRNRLQPHGAGQLEFDCPGLPMGTSGSPLLTGVDPTGSGPGTVVGVIGGYQAGGVTENVSYSPCFGPGIAAVYRAALAQG